ncbi:hypothetical protein CVT26_005708, partial [Gymnopilus dilepis]
QRALELTPEGHANLPSRLNNLGSSFARQSIHLQQRALELTPEVHADLPSRLQNLGNSFIARYKSTHRPADILLAHSSYRTSAMSITGSPSVCLDSARRWAQLAPDLENWQSETLAAHDRVIELISIIAGMENTSRRRHELLKELSHDTTEAAAAALSVNQPSKAIEWLESGRCVVWNQINQLRTPMDEIYACRPDLAERFALLSNELENMGRQPDRHRSRMELPMHAQMSLEAEAYSQLKLVKEREQLLVTIRDIPGFESFLRPKMFVDVMRSMPEDGVTIVINADESRCDALVLTAGCNEPVHVLLERCSYEKATNLAETLRLNLQLRGLQSRYSEQGQPDARGMRATNQVHVLQAVLRDLWTDVVEPILKCLPAEFQDRDGKGDLPRIRWCPTGPFIFLPIHAAGNYDKGVSGRSLPEFAISSYIPNLSIFERLGSRRPASASNRGLLLISQPDTPGLPRIPCTGKETERTCHELRRRGIRTAAYTSEEATTDVILKGLESFSCIHFACHASQNTKDSLESAVHLYDGPLKLSEIMKMNLPHAELAFMSACQTSVGDESLPEEVVHLAAGMLTAGYRSVIATMWSISDTHAPDVAEDFYKCLLNDETAEGVVGLDITGSAQALHIAVQALRRKLGDDTEALLKWVPYVHFGI